MDATTFIQMQQEAQAQIDSLNSQITTLTNHKNDLVNENNTTISATQAQCDQMIADANSKSALIISSANTQAQSISDLANKAKSDADEYVNTQEANIDSAKEKLKQDQEDLLVGQNKLASDSAEFDTKAQDTLARIISQVTIAKTALDTAVSNISMTETVSNEGKN